MIKTFKKAKILWEDTTRYVKIKDVKLIVNSAYKKYVIPNKNDANGMAQLMNHPISAMRAEILEKLKRGMKR